MRTCPTRMLAVAGVITVGLAAAPALAAAPGAAAPASASGDPTAIGAFGAPFAEDGVTDPAKACTLNASTGISTCIPAAASVMVLPNGKLLYWDALEGMEDVKYNVVLEYGAVAQNDQSRVLDLSGAHPTWTTPFPYDGGANPNGNPNPQYVLPSPLVDNNNTRNDGDLFCSDQVFLANGDVLDAGGTDYYLEPGASTPAGDYGVSELEGLRNTRIYDPATNTFTQSGQMNYGRWYPGLVTLPNGKIFVASGVTKLIKPVYTSAPQDSGTNVEQTETYDPQTAKWTVNGGAPDPVTGRRSADHSLPLFPRLHLLPDGHVYYDAGGQTYNPMGQSYDEALWNLAASYDPATQTWTDLGVPMIGESPQLAAPLGFRGSGFSQMLTLTPPYTTAHFLSAGGVLGVSPGDYVATDTSTLNTVTLRGGQEVFSSEATGHMVNARWYSTGVTLPTGQVLAFSGATRDEVVAPGSGTPVTQAEMYDPATKTWHGLAFASHGRTYHNTAELLADGPGRVGGHAPIATGYGAQNSTLHDTLGFSTPHRDPSFEIYYPPYLFWGPRPVITGAAPLVQRGSNSYTISTPDAASIRRVVLVRNTAITHLVDGDQRTVALPIVRRSADTLTVAITPNAAVLPAGPYHLFIDKGSAKGLIPSVSRQVFVGTALSSAMSAELQAAGQSQARTELAARRATSRTAPAGATPAAASAARPGSAAPGLLSAAAAGPAALNRAALSPAALNRTGANRTAPWAYLLAALAALLLAALAAVRYPRRGR